MDTPSNATLATNATTHIFTIVDNDSSVAPPRPTGAYLNAGWISLQSAEVNAYGIGASETLVLRPTASQIVIDQNIDRVYLENPASAYLFQQTGNRLNVFPAAGGAPILVAALQNDADGTVMIFPNGTASATVGPSGMRLGGAFVPILATAIDPMLDSFVEPPSGPSTAGVFLGPGANFTAASDGLKVYGTAGIEVVTLARGTSDLKVDQSVERVQLNGFATQDLQFLQRGNTLVVYRGADQLARITLQADTDGTLITTTDGTMQARVNATGMFLGGAKVNSSTPTAVEPLQVDFLLRATSDSLTVTIAEPGSFDASKADITFTLPAIIGSYTYAISGFDNKDRIVGPAGITATITDQESFTDGSVTLRYALAGNVVRVTLTGLTSEQDGAILSTSDLNTYFGAGTLS